MDLNTIIDEEIINRLLNAEYDLEQLDVDTLLSVLNTNTQRNGTDIQSFSLINDSFSKQINDCYLHNESNNEIYNDAIEIINDYLQENETLNNMYVENDFPSTLEMLQDIDSNQSDELNESSFLLNLQLPTQKDYDFDNLSLHFDDETINQLDNLPTIWRCS